MLGKIKEFSKRILAPKVYASKMSTTQLVNVIFDFCEILTGVTLYPYQEQFSKRIIRSILLNDAAEITSLFSRQSGKSETVSVTVAGMLVILPSLANMPMFLDDIRLQPFRDGLWVGIFAPTKQQAQITYGRIRDRLESDNGKAVLASEDFRLSFTTSNGQTVALTNGSYVTAVSASEGSNIEGSSFKLLILEEAQDISNYKIQKSIHPMGAAYNATIVKIGTATSYRGDFYDAIMRNKEELSRRSSHMRNHFEYDYLVASKYNPQYEKYIEREIKRLGENSDYFRMSYKLEWVMERGMFIDVTKFEQNNGEYSLDRSLENHQANHVVGIDVGGKGDSTVITVCEVDWSMPVIEESMSDPETGEDIVYTAYNTYLVDWYEIENVPDYEEQFDMIMTYLTGYNVNRITMDTTREASLAHRIRANVKCEVVFYTFTRSSKSDLYKNLEREITTGRARFTSSENSRETVEYQRFLEQMGGLIRSFSGTYMVVSHGGAKDDHDDYPDSYALAVWGARSPADTMTGETRTNVFTKKTYYENLMNQARNQLTGRRR